MTAAASFAAEPGPTSESALKRGLGFLVQQQSREGSFGTGNARVLATSRALLVFLQVGNVPDSGRYGLAVKSAEEWMLASIRPSGAFAGSDDRTRPQAMAVLALAETYGAESNPERRGRLLAALQLAVGPLLALQVPAQTPARADAGGWGDEKNSAATVQLTAIAAIALSSARDVGVPIPPTVLDQAKRYILACGDSASGGFALQLGKAATVDATAAALVTLDVLSPGGDDTDRATSAAKYLENQPAATAVPSGYIGAAWVCWCDARLELPAAGKIRDAYVNRLIATQDAEGAWNPPPVAKPNITTPTRLAVTELALIGLTAHFRSTPVLRH